MRTPQDIGGLPEGPVDPSEHMLNFWEKQADGLRAAVGAKGLMSSHESRRAIESLGEDAMERLWAAVDVRETPASYELSTDMPGLTTENVKVTLEDDNILRIAGERRREEETETQGYKRVERSFGTFERRFKLPTSVEPGEIKASLEHGVLRVVVPKKEAEKELPKEVPIQVQGNSGAAKQA